jgi:hypothetical protein
LFEDLSVVIYHYLFFYLYIKNILSLLKGQIKMKISKRVKIILNFAKNRLNLFLPSKNKGKYI